jgi:uncharacterized membrane protein
MAMDAMQWIRRTFVTGFFVTVPLVVSVVAIVWMFQWADHLTSGLVARFGLGEVPGLGILVTAAIVFAVGALATNVFGRRVLSQGDRLLLHLPFFRAIYAPVKQLITAFSPENEMGFKRVVLVDDADRGFLLGFLTREFTLDRGRGPEPLLAIYVPTNHLYLGDVIVCEPARVSMLDISVEEGLRIFLTGGMGLPGRLSTMKGEDSPKSG